MPTVADLINTADGKPASGQLTVSWDRFISSTGRDVFPGALQANIVGGRFSVRLEASPARAPYRVDLQLYGPGGSNTTEYWRVPPTDLLLTRELVLTTAVPAPLITFADRETPSGLVNGSNANFTLAAAPDPPASLLFFRDKQLQLLTADYTLSGLALHCTSPPAAGASLLAWYRY